MLRQTTHENNLAIAAPTLDSILRSIRVLITPSASLYYACNRERIEHDAAQLSVLDIELESLRKRALSAGAQLTALQQQAPNEGVAS